MLILKVTKNKSLHSLSLQTVYFFKYILKVKAWIFFIETSILFLLNYQSYLSFYSNKNELKKTVRKITREKVWRPIYGFWYLPTKFWHTYMITYGDFRLIVEPYLFEGRKIVKISSHKQHEQVAFDWEIDILILK